MNLIKTFDIDGYFYLLSRNVVYAELAADGHFETRGALDRFLADLSVQLADVPAAAVFSAGEAFRRYLDRRPDDLQCPSCGAIRSVDCEACGDSLAPRQYVAADFLIGGHASETADALVTFDGVFYGTYFPSVSVRQ